MAEFSLPKNSKVEEGKNFPYKGKSENKKVFNIYSCLLYTSDAADD